MEIITEQLVAEINVALQQINSLLTPIAQNLNKIGDMDVPEAAMEYVRFRTIHDALKSTYEDISVKIKSQLSDVIIPGIFDRKDVSSFTLKNGTRVTMSTRTTASIKDKENGHKWLRENGLGDLIVETVNSSTLAATAKSFKEQQNMDLPVEYFKVTYQPSTSVTKGKSQ